MIKQLNESFIKPIEPTADTVLDYHKMVKQYDYYMGKVAKEVNDLLRIKYKMNLSQGYAFTKNENKINMQLTGDGEIPEEAIEEIKDLELKYGVKIEMKFNSI